jgi:hypothetical protein
VSAEALRVLLIQSWVIPGAVVRGALVACGYHPQIYRVDFESALVAALPRATYDLVIVDPKTSGLSRTHVEVLMRDHGVRAPLVELVPGKPLEEQLRAALAPLRN